MTAIQVEHEPVVYRDRVVCKCGDFNCASLDDVAERSEVNVP